VCKEKSPMTKNHYQRLEKMYLNANVNKDVYDTTQCNFEESKCTITLEADQKYFHALGAIHGSTYFKLLDDAAFFAAQCTEKDFFVLTTSFNINITKPVSKGKLTAIGHVRFDSKNLIIAESVMYNEKGQEVAFGTGYFAKSKIPLSEEIGY